MSNRAPARSSLAVRLSLALAAHILLFFSDAAGFVVMYHGVDDAHSGAALAVTSSVLAAQLESLARDGFHFGVLDDAGKLRHEKTVFVTFDDGRRSVFTRAFPVLKQRRIAATAFVIVEKVGNAGFMTWKELGQLSRAGWVIGSHSGGHETLSELSAKRVEESLRRSLRVLRAHLGRVSPCVAYPFGRHDQRVRDVAKLFYGCGLTTGFGDHRRFDPYAVPRPLLSPVDTWGLAWRSRDRQDLRAFFLPLATTFWLLPAQRPVGTTLPFLNPARFHFMGDGELTVRLWEGAVYQTFFFREGKFAISGAAARVGKTFTQINLIGNEPPLSVSVGWTNSGPELGAALALSADTEVWADYVVARAFTLGTTAIVTDYLQADAQVSTAGGPLLHLKYALPLLEDEGRPVHVIAGYDNLPFFGAAVNIGSFTIEATARTDGDFGFAAGSFW